MPRRVLLTITTLLFSIGLWSQESDALQMKLIPAGTDSVMLDSSFIVPSSLVFRGDLKSQYRYDRFSGKLYFTPPLAEDIEVSYFRLGLEKEVKYMSKDSTMIRSKGNSDFDPYVFSGDLFPESDYEQGDLVKAGSISRGVTFGNSQDLAVNSNLNLQLTGKITDRLSVLASITDDNIPIQPDGNTQQLQDFDRVFIQLFDDRNSITAGDFQITEKENHFLKYQKRARGATGTTTWSDSLRSYEISASAAISKGKFARNIIQGVEGNQGPYRLTGAENERFIIIMAGTERVFIDGRLLKRGQAYDYTIDYNSSEITFTPNNLITKDRRIVVEFQYADRNYARALLQAEVKGEEGKFSWFVHALSEQDSKNQPLQQDLDLDDRILLSNVGDDLLSAVSNAIDSIGYSDEQVLYASVDSLGYDSVLVFSVDPDIAVYRAVFSFVGQGQGDYVEDGFSALGRVYRWVAPDTVDGQIIKTGDHAPVRLLVSPKKRQMLTAGGTIQFAEDHSLHVEVGISSRDENTFSRLDSSDNTGTSVWTDYRIAKQIKEGGEAKLKVRLFHEYVSQHFSEIERWRSVEFDRDWNVRGLTLSSDQHVGGVEIGILKGQNLDASITASTFHSGSGYQGYRGSSALRYMEKKRNVVWDGSFTQSEGLVNTRFLRQRTNAAWPVGPILVGFKDDFEWNQYFQEDTLAANSYRFHEWQGWLGSQEGKPLNWRLYYSQRNDRLPTQNELTLATFAQEYGVEGNVTGKKNRRFGWNVRRRTLTVSDSSLTLSRPEETLLGRIEAGADLLKGLLNGQLFYETGSGLEQARQFIYIEVPAGQGNYVWIDYNGDGVKDLNEFEIAAFTYEANYLRTFVPSDEYVQTYTNQFTANAQLQPARVWSNEKGWKRFASRFSDATSIRLDRKSGRGEGLERLNPIQTELNDTSLLSLGSQFRNTFSFDRSNPDFGVDYTFQQLRNRVLLANGFEARGDRFNEIRVRKKLLNGVTAIVAGKEGRKGTASDFLTGRNYEITYNEVKPEVQWQPGTTFRLTASGRWTERQNQEDFGGEFSSIRDYGLSARYSAPGKGLVEASFNWVQINYNGEGNNALSFEMLEGLQAGNNATWNLSVQRSLSRSLQLNVIYNGRNSGNAPTVHAGSVQVRATF